MFKTVTFISFLFSQMVFAGGWVMGGGDQVGSKLNPWFLKSEEKIKYCVKIDKKSISASESQIKSLVSASLKYWRKDFLYLEKMLSKSSARALYNLKNATQDFQEVSCESAPELRFLFGHDVLSPEEAHFLESYDLIAGSIRTDYDEQKLIGRGFIYIPSDIGANSFVKKNQVQRPWEKPGLLMRALVHELGHTFGLQHSDVGIMRADYPETILNATNFMNFIRIENIPSTLLPSLGDYTLADASVAEVRTDIRVMSISDGHPDITFMPSGITLEWSSSIISPNGDENPMLIRLSPFLQEIYEIDNGRIKATSRLYKQCRSNDCVSD